MKENGGSPTAWHARWTTIAKLQTQDAGVSVHELATKLIEVMVCYDQLNVGSLASAELLCRQIQDQEMRWQDRVLGSMSDAAQQTMTISGTSSTRTNLCIHPKLVEWMAEQGKNQTAALKELRKAREERALAKPKGKSTE